MKKKKQRSEEYTRSTSDLHSIKWLPYSSPCIALHARPRRFQCQPPSENPKLPDKHLRVVNRVAIGVIISGVVRGRSVASPSLDESESSCVAGITWVIKS